MLYGAYAANCEWHVLLMHLSELYSFIFCGYVFSELYVFVHFRRNTGSNKLRIFVNIMGTQQILLIIVVCRV